MPIGQERPGFNPRSRHNKNSKMVLDAACLNSNHYNVQVKGKVEQIRGRSSILSYKSVL